MNKRQRIKYEGPKGLELVYSTNTETKDALKTICSIKRQQLAVEKKREKLNHLRGSNIYIDELTFGIYPIRPS